MSGASARRRGALAVFARPVEPGRVKTRLARAVGDATAAVLYRAFLEDTIATAGRVPDLLPTLWTAGDPGHPSLATLAPGWRRRRQPETDLGDRMGAALRDGLENHAVALVVGTDAPTMPAALLARALAALAPERGAPCPQWVVGPSTDGGFWVLGARAPVPEGLLTGVTWSAPTTLEETRARLEPRLGPPALLPPWYDVDGPEDLRLLRAHLRVAPEAAPATHAALAGNSPEAGGRSPFSKTHAPKP